MSISTTPSVHRVLGGLKEFLRDKRGHKRAQDDYGYQNRVLPLIDNVVLKSEERRDRSESQACRHQQCRVGSFSSIHEVSSRERPHADSFRYHL